MAKFRVFLGGLSWSLSFLVAMTAMHSLGGFFASAAAVWVLKIAWSTAHTALSRHLGARAANLQVTLPLRATAINEGGAARLQISLA